MAALRRVLFVLVLLTVASPAFAQVMREDTVTSNGELGMVIMVKRCDTAAATSNTDGDHTLPCVDSSGKLWVNSSSTSPVLTTTVRLSDGTNYVTLATDPTHDSAAATSGPQEMGECDDSATDAVDEGDAGRLRIDCTNRQLFVRHLDPCTGVAKTTTAISLTTDTVIISATSGKKNYICSLVVVAGAAEIVSVTEGTGSVCASSEAALVGSTTDANGMSFAANGGASIVGGNSTVIAGISTNVDTCLNVSGSNRVSGFVTWVQAP